MAEMEQEIQAYEDMLTGILQQVHNVLQIEGVKVEELAAEHLSRLNNIRDCLKNMQKPENIQHIVKINSNLLIMQQIYILLEIPEHNHALSLCTTVKYKHFVNGDVANLADLEDQLQDVPAHIPDTPETSDGDE